MLANPTHIAVGIYVNDAIVEWPFVSIKEKNRRALAVIAYAESIGVPVILDRRVARAVYETSTRYGFVGHGVVEEVTRLLKWLNDVEQARTVDPFVQVDRPDAP